MMMNRYALILFLSSLSAGATSKEVEVGVLGLFHPREVVVLTVEGSALECGTQPGNQTSSHHWQVQLARTQMRIAADGRVLSAPALSCDDGHGSETEFRISIPGKISRRYRGRLEIKPGRNELLVIVSMELETAVASVVAAESPPGAPMEALKAQAVAARSFLVAGGKRHRDYDFCDTTHCQFLREPPVPTSLAWQAMMATRGLVLAYRGQAFAAMYSASCGGRTHSLGELGISVRDYPYYSVECSYCRRHPKKWATRLDRSDASNLNSTESSRLQLARRLGWKTVPSNSYSTRQEANSVILEGTGAGHGIGLCQSGGAAMARDGSTFVEILKYYYPNTILKTI
ncbi:MAG TPA: SpoIID/LytB domain-containing protein [Verrucomicrobiae bacterium]|jgi:peptidoglycan hydrolase-like amidase|nr:SpoIID/LytB domain-containing protein [Verrucomicrobiae bacterium]